MAAEGTRGAQTYEALCRAFLHAPAQTGDDLSRVPETLAPQVRRYRYDAAAGIPATYLKDVAPGVHVLGAAKMMGKSNAILEFCRGKHVLFVTFSRRLSDHVYLELKEANFTVVHYRHDNEVFEHSPVDLVRHQLAQEDGGSASAYAFCDEDDDDKDDAAANGDDRVVPDPGATVVRVVVVNSLLKAPLGLAYDAVVLDEVESIFNACTPEDLGGIIHRDRLKLIFELLAQCRRCRQVVVADAMLTGYTLEWCAFVAAARGDPHWAVHEFTHRPQAGRTAHLWFDENEWLLRAYLDVYVHRRRIVVACATRALAKRVYRFFDDCNAAVADETRRARVLAVLSSNDNAKLEGKGINETWRRVDVLVYSPCISAGLSFTVRAHFAKCFWAVCGGFPFLPDVRTQLQMSSRVRDVRHYDVLLQPPWALKLRAHDAPEDLRAVPLGMAANSLAQLTSYMLDLLTRRAQHNHFTRLYSHEAAILAEMAHMGVAVTVAPTVSDDTEVVARDLRMALTPARQALSRAMKERTTLRCGLRRSHPALADTALTRPAYRCLARDETRQAMAQFSASTEISPGTAGAHPATAAGRRATAAPDPYAVDRGDGAEGKRRRVAPAPAAPPSRLPPSKLRLPLETYMWTRMPQPVELQYAGLLPPSPRDFAWTEMPAIPLQQPLDRLQGTDVELAHLYTVQMAKLILRRVVDGSPWIRRHVLLATPTPGLCRAWSQTVLRRMHLTREVNAVVELALRRTAEWLQSPAARAPRLPAWLTAPRVPPEEDAHSVSLDLTHAFTTLARVGAPRDLQVLRDTLLTVAFIATNNDRWFESRNTLRSVLPPLEDFQILWSAANALANLWLQTTLFRLADALRPPAAADPASEVGGGGDPVTVALYPRLVPVGVAHAVQTDRGGCGCALLLWRCTYPTRADQVPRVLVECWDTLLAPSRREWRDAVAPSTYLGACALPLVTHTVQEHVGRAFPFGAAQTTAVARAWNVVNGRSVVARLPGPVVRGLHQALQTPRVYMTDGVFDTRAVKEFLDVSLSSSALEDIGGDDTAESDDDAFPDDGALDLRGDDSYDYGGPDEGEDDGRADESLEIVLPHGTRRAWEACSIHTAFRRKVFGVVYSLQPTVFYEVRKLVFGEAEAAPGNGAAAAGRTFRPFQLADDLYTYLYDMRTRLLQSIHSAPENTAGALWAYESVSEVSDSDACDKDK